MGRYRRQEERNKGKTNLPSKINVQRIRFTEKSNDRKNYQQNQQSEHKITLGEITSIEQSAKEFKVFKERSKK